MDLVAILDWWRRYVLVWQRSHTLDGACGLEALDMARVQGCPEMFNTDQGVQFPRLACTSRLERAGVAIRMDAGAARWTLSLSNAYGERSRMQPCT